MHEESPDSESHTTDIEKQIKNESLAKIDTTEVVDAIIEELPNKPNEVVVKVAEQLTEEIINEEKQKYNPPIRSASFYEASGKVFSNGKLF